MNKIILFSLIFISTNVFPQSPEGYISLRGVGQFNCGQYMTAINDKNEAQLNLYSQWIWGYIAAYQMRGQFGSGGSLSKKQSTGNITTPDQETVQLFMKKHCSENPLSNVLAGTISLIEKSGGLVSQKK